MTTTPTTAAPHESRIGPSRARMDVPPERPVQEDRSPLPTAQEVEEFGTLLEPVLDRAYQAALYMTRNAAEAEDVVQDAALMALAGFGGFERGTNFKAWFLRIVTNAFLMRCRKDRRSLHDHSLDEPDGLFLYERTKQAGWHLDDADPARTFFSRLTDEQVREAIFELPEQFRVVAALYFVEDLSYQEIADIAGTPVGTVRSRLHRARALLQKRLWHIAEDYGIVVPRAGAPVDTLPA